MTDNRTTELLRELLDERGVSCQTNYLHTSWRVGSKLYEAMDNLDGTLTVGNLIPEQAIAATLGVDAKDCENLLWEFIGALDVADATDADKKPIVSDYARHIAATLGVGECEFVGDAKYPPKCSSCGWQAGIYDCEWLEDGEYEYDGNFCKQCGARIRKEVKR